MPGQQRARRDQAMATQPGWQQAGQPSQDCPVGPVKPGTGDLAAQDRYLMTEHHDLGVLRRLAAAQQEQPAKDLGHGEIQKSDRHRPRSCLITGGWPNRRSQTLLRVLGQHKYSQNARDGNLWPPAATTESHTRRAIPHGVAWCLRPIRVHAQRLQAFSIGRCSQIILFCGCQQ